MSEEPILYDCNGDAILPKRREFPWWIIGPLACIFGTVIVLLCKPKPKEYALTVATATSSVTFATTGTFYMNTSGAFFKEHPPEIKAPMGHPPLKIIAGAQVYTVHYTTAQALKARGCGGYTDLNTREIWLARDIDDSLEQRHVFLHELMHVAMAERDGYLRRFEPGGTDDEFIEETSPALLGILRNNPRLIDWFQR